MKPLHRKIRNKWIDRSDHIRAYSRTDQIINSELDKDIAKNFHIIIYTKTKKHEVRL